MPENVIQYRYKLEYHWFNPNNSNQLILLTNQFNGAIKAGWHVDKIIPMADNHLLVVYIGLSSEDQSGMTITDALGGIDV